MSGGLTPRWTILRPHPEQSAWWNSPARFNVIPAGRRSGKTEIAKRKLVMRALEFYEAPNGRFIASAPTRQQAKRIYWADLKAMIPRDYLMPQRKAISESELIIWLYNGARIEVCGMDAPERIEGDPIDGIVLDEYGNMQKKVWEAHVRPGLFTAGRPPGWADMIGVPEGRNHYYQMYKRALTRKKDWAGFTWKSADILPPEEIKSAREELDPLTFRQEYEADFITFAGRCYYQFQHESHCEPCFDWYNPERALIFCFDFNVSPGIAVVLQELPYQGSNGDCASSVTAILDEVWLENNSTTIRVCDMLLKRWRKHPSRVICYGDPAGGARGTAKVQGNDWELIRAQLGPAFGDRLSFNVPSSAPPERSRVNAVNSRLRSANGTIRMIVDPQHAVHTTEDFDGVRANDEGHIDKKTDKMLTHLSDAVGYYIQREHPIDGERALRSMQL